ncbi:MAG TPA: cytochrome c oxidase assembly protein [Tepidisphaeraceae bacterium]|nr:cytochrome c oxidase assembly protein [Tepidisphaeraceae bacterium]
MWWFVLAHGGESHQLWSRWNLDGLTIGSLAVLSILYGIGLARLWRSAGAARGVSRRQPMLFAAAILALVIALISPLDPASDELQSAHMVQHMLIMMVAAPLFILGAPALVMLWALPRDWRREVGRWLGRLGAWRPPWYLLWQPLLMCVLFALALWVWHLPVLYEAALRSRPVHELQHISFFVVSCLFWRVLVDPLSRLRMNVGAGVLYLFLTSLHATFLGVFMALSPRVWYPDYLPRTAVWNLTPLEDQQLAGLIMWMPACMVYALVAAVMFALWVHQGDRDAGAVVVEGAR